MINIHTGIPEDQVTKIVHEKGPGHTFVELFYPNGLVITCDMLPDGTVNVDANKPLKQNSDGSLAVIY